MKLSLKLFAFLLISSVSILTIHAQINVELKIDESENAGTATALFCDKEFNCGLRPNETIKKELFGKDKTPIEIKRIENGFNFTINPSQKNKGIFLKKNSSIKVRIPKTLQTGGIVEYLYEITHSVKEKNGEIYDRFSMSQHYRAIGTLNYKTCTHKVALIDKNDDGVFNLSDADGGTNFSIDINNDNIFWGKEEKRKTSEIIEVCGQNFLVSSLEKNVLILNPTDLKIARVGQIVPSFSFTLLNGKIVSSESLKGEFYVFDFWASWCKPCIANLSEIAKIEKEYKDKLALFSINVDEKDRKDLANKIIIDNHLFDYSTIRGMGDEDIFWKMFGSESTRLSIPLYVLVDKDGILRYADSGGEDLKELKAEIEKLIEK